MKRTCAVCNSSPAPIVDCKWSSAPGGSARRNCQSVTHRWRHRRAQRLDKAGADAAGDEGEVLLMVTHSLPAAGGTTASEAATTAAAKAATAKATAAETPAAEATAAEATATPMPTATWPAHAATDTA